MIDFIVPREEPCLDWTAKEKWCRLRTAMTGSAVKRGVPRSPNRDIDQLGIFRKEDLRRREIELDRLFYVVARFVFGFSRRSAAG